MGTASGCFRSSAQRRPPPLHLRTAPQLHAPLIHSAMTMSLGSRSRPSSAHAHAPTHSGTPHALLLSEATYIHGLMPHIHACALTVIGHKQRARRAHHAAPCAPAWPSKRSSTDSCMVICCHTYMQLHTWIVICRIYACGCIHGLSPHMPHIHAAAYMDCRPMFPSLCRG